jgi:poly-gamma-glutamate capsule biosynthesis protein CapA/YwtB (metallophosphatase superfamily)
MAATLALAGDTMLGRGVAEQLTAEPRAALIAAEVAECLAGADAFVLNLECCISHRGDPFPDPAKPFFFRAPPIAAQRLAELGVDAVTLANNHALDYGPSALLDTLSYLQATGIAAVGAGADLESARAPLILPAVACASDWSGSRTTQQATQPAPSGQASRSPSCGATCPTGCSPRSQRAQTPT